MVWLATLICVNLQTSFLTPPFGWALFFLRGVAPPEITTGDIYRGIVPFVLMQLLALVLVFLLPGAGDLAAQGDRLVAQSGEVATGSPQDCRDEKETLIRLRGCE